MDFYRIVERPAKNGVTEVYPDFIVKRSEDIMIRGGDFYAVWDETNGLWTTDQYAVQYIVDRDISKVANEAGSRSNASVAPRYMHSYSSGSWAKFMTFVTKLPDNYIQLDRELTFSNTEVDKKRYASKRLPYPLVEGSIDSYDEIMSTLYNPTEREKLEWAIGAIISGDSRFIQKFIVLYGQSGAGKSTFLQIVQDLFEGYYSVFDAKSLVGSNNAFATEAFKSNPLVGIQHDGDLSKIEDNTKLNEIVSHEEMIINEKHKSTYSTALDTFLFMGTNKPVKITDAKSGIIRRLIDVQPSGNKIPYSRYKELMGQIKFELGAIASHCLKFYLDRGPDYYDAYVPEEMMLMTDYFYNYIETFFDVFKQNDGVALSHAYKLYKEYCADSEINYILNRVNFREELKNYFHNFDERAIVDGERIRSWYSGFKTERFRLAKPEQERYILEQTPLTLDKTVSVLDIMLEDEPAQYASPADTPMSKWSDVTTTLSDIDTSKVHYVKLPENHIVIDFDIKNPSGEKDAELNLIAASKFPPTYSEFSKGGAGIHLHYIYQGDVSELAAEYEPGVEIKVFRGNASLRRRLSYCNGLDVATISSGLPKKEKKMINEEAVKSEKALRDLIERNLRKEIHPGTKPSMDFIKKILDDAYESDLVYDLTDMRPRIMQFANNSTNQALYCLKLLTQLKLQSDENKSVSIPKTNVVKPVFYDVEVFPNLFVVCWKVEGSEEVMEMINPSASDVEKLMKMPLVGFNNRRYDNHILYGAMMGMDNQELYNYSQKIVQNDRSAPFANAYGISYTDIYDYASKKQSLKKWEIDLGIHHQELGLPWDQPVSEDLWPKVVSYCKNDVIATEATFHATKADFKARQILAAISGLTVNDKTDKHTSRILFHGDKNHKTEFEYTDLSKMFPGYKFDPYSKDDKSTYKGVSVGEGGYVYAEPGIYKNVALIDVASMHPTSAINMNIFGKYTKNYKDILDARIAIKHGDFETARKMLDGKLAPYLEDESDADELAYALKIVINIVYGLTSAKFENDFNDPRNKDNIVAKRGALFMVDLMEAVKDKGYTVVHIKTDSIKIADADDDIIEFVMRFGKQYGYSFEHEATYEKFCLVNNAVYVAKDSRDGHWTATGAQFKHPYVFKKLFSNEEITFQDLYETKEVKTQMFLDLIETVGPGEQHLHFVGRIGAFLPMLPGSGAGVLLRYDGERYHAVTGTKGYLWQEAEVVETLGLHDKVDMSYYEELVTKAVQEIERFGSYTMLVS